MLKHYSSSLPDLLQNILYITFFLFKVISHKQMFANLLSDEHLFFIYKPNSHWFYLSCLCVQLRTPSQRLKQILQFCLTTFREVCELLQTLHALLESRRKRRLTHFTLGAIQNKAPVSDCLVCSFSGASKWRLHDAPRRMALWLPGL